MAKEDVYKHFCSAYHWYITEDALKAIPENANTPITNIHSWSVGHMLLPVRLVEENNSVNAEFSGLGFKICIFNLFIPSDMEIQTDAVYSTHFAAVISEINLAQAKMISQQLEAINRFIEFRKETKAIDYLDFQKIVNYRSLCESRYCKYFNSSWQIKRRWSEK
jgi:hypothetical protein